MKYGKMFLATLPMVLLIGCGGSGKAKANQDNDTKRDSVAMLAYNLEFPFVEVPEIITDQQAAVDYMVEHYWDRFDFDDTAFIESDALNNGMAMFVMTILNSSSRDVAGTGIDRMLRGALKNSDMYYTIYDGMEYFLGYPNSELRNNEVYILFLETMLGIEELGPEERVAPEESLRMAKLNRVDTKANNFYYTDESGKEYDMYGINAEYLVVYFYNLGCPTCGEVSAALTDVLTQNAMIKELSDNGRLKILMVYPPIDKSENALADWRAHKSEVPAFKCIINSYDKRAELYDGDKYDLAALPSLYLLDKNKNVVLRDFTSPYDMAQAIQIMESRK